MDILEFNGRAIGCGGFVNITRTAKEVVFAGSFTAGGSRQRYRTANW
jgi:propionate CoA-transferase